MSWRVRGILVVVGWASVTGLTIAQQACIAHRAISLFGKCKVVSTNPIGEHRHLVHATPLVRHHGHHTGEIPNISYSVKVETIPRTHPSQTRKRKRCRHSSNVAVLPATNCATHKKPPRFEMGRRQPEPEGLIQERIHARAP